MVLNIRHSLILQLFLLSFFTVSQVEAQKILYLKPFLSGQFPSSYYDRSIGKAPNFSATYLNIALGGGIDVQLELNRKWRLSLGGHYGIYGFGYFIKTPMYGRSSDNSDYITRIPFQIHYTIKDEIHLINVDKIKYAYLIVGRIYSLFGISYNQVAPPGNFGQLSIGGSSIIVDERKPVIDRWSNVSAYLGLGMQFYSGGNDRFDISLYYSKGFGKIVYQDLFYEINSASYHTRLWSRGTIIGFNIGYPIRLKTFKTRNERSIYKQSESK